MSESTGWITNIPATKRHYKQPPLQQTQSIRWRGTLLCLGASLLIAGFSAPLTSTLIAQLRSVSPQIDVPIEESVYRGMFDEIRRDRPVTGTRSLCRILHDHANAAPKLDVFQNADPQNGLYTYMDILMHLRGRAPGTTDPPFSIDADILRLLRQLPSESPARLYQVRERQLSESYFKSHGVSARRAAVESRRISEMQSFHRPVLRELADDLLKKGIDWRNAGQPKDALLAHAAIVKLFDDVLNDSPTPDIALLAAERLPAALREIGKDAEASGTHLSTDAETAATQVAAFPSRWHGAVDRDRVNIIPWTGDYVIAEAAHERLMGSLWPAMIVDVAWLTLAGAVLILLLVVAGTKPLREHAPSWRSQWKSALLSPLIVLVPQVVFIAVLSMGTLPFTWLITLQSALVASVAPCLVVLMIGAAARMCTTLGEHERARPRAAALWILMTLLMASAVAGWLLLPVQREPWRPPLNIQRFRTVGLLVSFECAIIFLIWTMWGWFRRRRAGMAAGVSARADLAVAARALLACSIISFIISGINQRNDGLHQDAFLRAAADPLTDRLGPTWRQDHFNGAAALLHRLASTQ